VTSAVIEPRAREGGCCRGLCGHGGLLDRS